MELRLGVTLCRREIAVIKVPNVPAKITESFYNSMPYRYHRTLAQMVEKSQFPLYLIENDENDPYIHKLRLFKSEKWKFENVLTFEFVMKSNVGACRDRLQKLFRWHGDGRKAIIRSLECELAATFYSSQSKLNCFYNLNNN